MNFNQYIQGLSRRLGEHQLPLNGSWFKAAGIVREDAVHYALMKQAVTEIYKQNRCTNGKNPVQLNAVLDALGEVQRHLIEQADTDFEAMKLIQTIGEISIDLFGSDNLSDKNSDHSVAS